jgi:hypothetical protein
MEGCLFFQATDRSLPAEKSKKFGFLKIVTVNEGVCKIYF